MSSLTSWLENKKREAAAMRRVGQVRPSSFSRGPLRSRYMGNTGAGEDGVVQPSNPTDIVDTSMGRRMLHEDENIFMGNDGSMTIQPSRYTQRQLRDIEQEEDMEGYQTGGTTNLRTRGLTSPVTGTAPAFGTNQPAVPQIAPVEAETRTGPTFTRAPLQTTPTQVSPNIIGRDTTTLTAPDMGTRVQSSVLNTTPVNGVNPEQPVTGTAPTFTRTPAATPTQVSPAIPQPSGTPTTTAPPTAVPSLEDRARQTAMGRLMSAARGNLPEYDAATQKYLDDLKGTIGTEQQVAAQQAAQLGYSPEMAAAQQAMGRAAGRSALAEATGAAAVGRGQLQQAAIGELAQESRAGQAFELDKQKYGDSTSWTAYEAAIAAGDFNTAAREYQNITGNPISMEQMQTYQNYLNTVRGQEVASNEIQLQGLKNSLGDQKFNSMVDRINSGASLDQVNSEFGTNISATDYANMKSATGFGQMQWERNLSAVNMLLQSQDPNNIREASQMIGNLFPGVTFDVDQLISDVGAERFAQSMQDMSTLAATYKNWNEAKTSAEGLNLIRSMGLNEEQAREMFLGLKINAIDEEWNAIGESDWFKNLQATEPDSANLVRDTFTKGLTGELEFDIKPVYNIVNSTGGFVTSFDNVVDANRYIGENADKGYSMKEDSDYIFKDMTTGDTVIVNNQTGTATSGTEGTTTVNDAWGNFQDSMSNIPEAEQPTYTQFKTAWNTAGKPATFTYDDYVKQAGTTGETAVTNIADKYKDGWPTLTTKIGEMNANKRDYIYTEGQKQDVLEARKNFIASPENTTTINPENARTSFINLAKDLEERQNNGELFIMPKGPKNPGAPEPMAGIANLQGATGGDDYRRSNLISIEGYDSPFVMTETIDYENGAINSINLINMATGKLATLYSDGRLVEAQTSGVNEPGI